MLATLSSAAVIGVDAIEIKVEVDVAGGLPSFDIVGLPGTSIRESRDRVRTAIKNAGFTFPLGRLTVNLAPAHIPKSGTLFDLPMAIGLLAASGQITPADWTLDAMFIGELSLDGSIKPVNGALCVAASLSGQNRVLVAPGGNEDEISVVPHLTSLTASSLKELSHELQAQRPAPNPPARLHPNDAYNEDPWPLVKGQEGAKRAIKIAIAGGHHVMLVGPPGAGKTMLARGAASIGVPLTTEEMIDVSRVYSVAGLLGADHPLVRRRPFRNPHHTVTLSGLIGGGGIPKPGEASLAHRGILFLDELPQFRREVLESLREPMEDGVITVSRAFGSATFPARFTLVAALNPCPCGFLHDPVKTCVCTPGEIHRYNRKLSGPLLDRVDLFVRMERVNPEIIVDERIDDIDRERLGHHKATSHPNMHDPLRIERAIKMQKRRFGDGRTNAGMSAHDIERYCRLGEDGRRLLLQGATTWMMSARSIHRTLKVARTIADLDGCNDLRADHIAESLAYRRETMLIS